MFRSKKIWSVLVVIILIIGGVYYFIGPSKSLVTYKTPEEADVFVRFDMEAYDSIVQNYWKKMPDADLAKLFQFSLQKATNAPALPLLVSQTRAGVATMLANLFNTATSTEAKKQLAVNTLVVATYNLLPQGRGGILSSSQETKFRQNVTNINPDNSLYQNLGVTKDATQQELDKALKQKEAELAKATTTEAKAELEQATYAHSVLSNPNTKTIYDQTQIEPTVFSHVIGSTLYLYLDKISPNTINEFAKAVDMASTTPKLSNMVIDLRGNVGGDLSFPQYFLGLFLGQNQYAFDLFHQDIYDVQRTIAPKFPELDKYKEIAVITDENSQSTTELLTASLKRFHLAHVVGTKTRGWGSVENTYPLKTVIDQNEKYSLLLVNSLTLADDNQPIESNGVLPDVDITDKNWKKELPNYFNSPSLIETIISVAEKGPTR